MLEECPDTKKELKTFNDKYDVNLEENDQMPSLQIHKYVKPFNRKFSHQIIKSSNMEVPHISKNPLTNNSEIKKIHLQIDKEFSKKNIVISNELRLDTINSSYNKIPLLDQT